MPILNFNNDFYVFNEAVLMERLWALATNKIEI
jgi:hypothetical protein